MRLKLETGAKRRDVANKTLPNQRTIVGDYKSGRRNTSASYSTSVHHMITVRTELLMNNRLDRLQKVKSHLPKLNRVEPEIAATVFPRLRQ